MLIRLHNFLFKYVYIKKTSGQCLLKVSFQAMSFCVCVLRAGVKCKKQISLLLIIVSKFQVMIN